MELDAIVTKNGHVALHHDYTLNRDTDGINGKDIRNLNAENVIGKPLLISSVDIHRDGTAEFSDRFTPTDQHVLSLESVVHLTQNLIEQGIRPSFFLDARRPRDVELLTKRLFELSNDETTSFAAACIGIKAWYYDYRNADDMFGNINSAIGNDRWMKKGNFISMTDVMFSRNWQSGTCEMICHRVRKEAKLGNKCQLQALILWFRSE